MTVQMTWQEGKSEGCREILRYDKKKKKQKCHMWVMNNY